VRHILYFTAEWCNPCKKVKPIVEELNRESADTRFQIVDADSEIDLVKSFEVRSIPTFILIEDGKEIKRVSGAQTKDQLESLMSHG
jgi:thioredoxin-like negative regulator of GroEL